MSGCIRLLLLVAVFGSFWTSAYAAQTAVIITNLPAYGSFNDLAGVVSGAANGSNAVAVFIYVPGYGWVSKPSCGQPLTPIQADGSWSADITTGGSDQLATRIAALLVSTNYNQPCVLGAAFLPTNVFAQALASAVVTRSLPGVRSLSFSGYDWWVKTSGGQVGPGPNYFSDSTNNVWVDLQGQLHLRITHRSNQWQCAEIVSARSFGNGSYRFDLGSTVNNVNQNAVLGLFTWSDDPVFANREIDVECSRWSNPADANNAQYVVQPYNVSGHLARYAVPVVETNSAHVFTWRTNNVSYESQRGSFSASPPVGKVITNWSYALDVPRSGDENVRINFWLFNGAAPSDNSEQEFVIKSFRYVPLGGALAATLTDMRRGPGGDFHVTVHGEMDRLYEVDASTNLSDWQGVSTILATNTSVEFVDSSSVPEVGRRFYRVIALP